MLQCVAVCCSVLQCVAVCCSDQHGRGHKIYIFVMFHIYECIHEYICIYTKIHISATVLTGLVWLVAPARQDQFFTQVKINQMFVFLRREEQMKIQFVAQVRTNRTCSISACCVIYEHAHMHIHVHIFICMDMNM